MAPKYFSSILFVKISADDRGIHNASCENRSTCVFPSQVWHQLISPEAVSTGHLIYDVPYQMTVGGAFVYVCERDHVIDFEQRSRVYITGVAVYSTWLAAIYQKSLLQWLFLTS